MFEKIIVTLFLLIFTNLTVFADCVTGYACSLKELQKQESVKQNENTKNILNENQNQNPQKLKRKQNKQGIFVDGKEYNTPQYTEEFTLKGIIE